MVILKNYIALFLCLEVIRILIYLIYQSFLCIYYRFFQNVFSSLDLYPQLLACTQLSNRRAIGEHTSTAVNCIPPAEVALNLAFGDFERNGDIYGHWGRDEGVE